MVSGQSRLTTAGRRLCADRAPLTQCPVFSQTTGVEVKGVVS